MFGGAAAHASVAATARSAPRLCGRRGHRFALVAEAVPESGLFHPCSRPRSWHAYAPLRRHSGSNPDPSQPWAAELERRRELRRSGGAPTGSPRAARQPTEGRRGEDGAAREQQEQSEGSAPEIDEASRAQLDRGAQDMQLFAYPASKRFPWATAALLAASGSLSAAVAIYWNFAISRSSSEEELQPRLRRFTHALGLCTVSWGDVAGGEVHRLILVSLLRAGEQPMRTLADAAVLVCCGTLVERLHGPAAVAGLVVGTTVVSNALAAFAHDHFVRAASSAGAPQASSSADPAGPALPAAAVASTSGGVVALGAWCVLRHGRWAVWPGVPVPVSWLMAPLLVSDGVAALSYRQKLPEYSAALAEAAGASPAHPPGLQLPVAFAACEAALDHARSQCRLPPDDIAQLQEELELALDQAPPPPPDGSFLGDVAGGILALVLAVAMRGRGTPLR